jgi:translation elongation factor EF-1alpha
MNLCKEHVLSDEDAMVVQQAFSKHLPDGVFTVRKKDRVSYTQRKLHNVISHSTKTKKNLGVMDSDRNLIPFMRVDLTTTTTTGNSLNDDSVIAEEIRHEIELE